MSLKNTDDIVIPEIALEVQEALRSLLVPMKQLIDAAYGRLGEDVNGFKPYGIDTRWEDLRFPAQGIDPVGQATPPGRDDDGTLLFNSINLIETVAGVAQMPHAWIEGTSIVPHVHWTKPSDGAGNVIWQFRYQMAGVGTEFGGWSDWIESADKVGPTDNAEYHSIASFGPVSMKNRRISTIILWQIRRDPTHAGDTYTADDAKLLEFDIHYQIDGNRMGSLEEFIKDG